MRKDVDFKWTDECEQALKEINDYLCFSPILTIYDKNKDVFIQTDASGKGSGAVLKQTKEDGILHPVAYFSRRLSPTESKKNS